MKSVISWLLYVVGVLLVVAGWLLFGDKTDKNIFIMNMIVSGVVYCVVFAGFVLPKKDDKAQSRIGSLGVRWFALTSYAVATIVVMFLSDHYGWEFNIRIYIHCILFVLLILGLLLVMRSAKKVVTVHAEETVNRSYVNRMRKVTDDLYNYMLDKGGFSANATSRVESLLGEIRFVSPANSDEARELEEKFVEVIEQAHIMASSYTFSEEQFLIEMARAERTLKRRKSVYSN
jgi:hypothetical protein